MVKVVYNNCYGGFSLFGDLKKRYKELGGTEKYDSDISRTSPILIQAVEEVKPDYLDIRDIPEGSKYIITEYDGMEYPKLLEEFGWQVA